MSENENQYLNKDIFSDKVERVSVRQGYAEGLLQAGEEDSRVVLLCADLTDSTGGGPFAKRFPDRFVQVGVAEQNLITVASGMASMGKIPFANSYAVFSPGRTWEQIRTTVCYNDVPVKIIGSHFGVSVGPDGGSHQALEDIALMRVLPNMVVISPCDSREAYKATLAIAKSDSPCYMRLSREKTPIITAEDAPFEIGRATVVFGVSEITEVGIIATGHLLYKALKVASKLKKEKGINVKVMNLSTIKPLDEEAILNLAKETGFIVTVEEHQIFGGMGSAVAEFLAKSLPTPMEFVGVSDQFGESGKAEELMEKYKMGEEEIEAKVLRGLERFRLGG